MKPISKPRFDSLAGYSRSPMMPLYATEVGWFQEADEKVLGLIVLDRHDNDYAYYTLGRDAKGRFRAVTIDVSVVTEAEALSRLEATLAEQAALPPEEFFQGDEKGKPVDFFTPLVDPAKLNTIFTQVIERKGYSPARELLSQMMYYFQDLDGNFIEQFQTTGFDARVWELYLYATFIELGYGLVRDHPAPDFHCRGLGGEFFVEATTVNPSVPAVVMTPENEEDYFNNFIPMKFSGALTAKLKKKYWTHEHVQGYPLLLAIQDFHAPGSMVWSGEALVEYLYGFRLTEKQMPDGTIEVVSEKLADYKWANKSPIAPGFFFQPDSENISAVLANPNGTIVKFNRMGFLAGFGDSEIKMLRMGTCFRDYEPQEFTAEVHTADYQETWCEGVTIYHNPNAVHPFNPDSFPNAAHIALEDERLINILPPFHPLSSRTQIIVGV